MAAGMATAVYACVFYGFQPINSLGSYTYERCTSRFYDRYRRGGMSHANHLICIKFSHYAYTHPAHTTYSNIFFIIFESHISAYTDHPGPISNKKMHPPRLVRSYRWRPGNQLALTAMAALYPCGPHALGCAGVSEETTPAWRPRGWPQAQKECSFRRPANQERAA